MLLSDTWIRAEAQKGMIDPFVEGQESAGVISYGLSSYGYDARVSDEFKIFTNVDNDVVDPKNFSGTGFVNRQTPASKKPVATSSSAVWMMTSMSSSGISTAAGIQRLIVPASK